MTEWMVLYLLILLLVGIVVLLWLAWGVLDRGQPESGTTRSCPVCGSALGKDEEIVATFSEEKPEGEFEWEEIRIKGCSQCLN